MHDLVKIGEFQKDGQAACAIFKSQLRGTYHIYDQEMGYVCAEHEDNEAFRSYERSMKRKGFEMLITAKPDKQVPMTTLRMPKDSWELLSETLHMDSKSKAVDPYLRGMITNALNSVTEITEE